MIAYSFGGFSGFGLFGMIFTLISFLIFVAIIIAIIRGVSQWNKNNTCPVLTVEAVCVAKYSRNDPGYFDHSTNSNRFGSTWFYATFEVESGDRIKFSLKSADFGMLAEGDKGMLTFQGTRFLSFVRDRDAKYHGPDGARQ